MSIDKLHSLHSAFNDIPNDSVLKCENIAELLGRTPECVRNWCRKGKLPAYKFGGQYVVMGSDFKSFMQKARVRTKAQQELPGNE